MKLVYYTSAHFLDAVFEHIKCLNDQIQLYLFIEINPYSRISTIVDLGDKDFPFLTRVKDVLTDEQYLQWYPYLKRVKEVFFIQFTSRTSIGLRTYRQGLRLKRHIQSIRPDIIHFDTISSRAFAVLPLLKKTKTIITIHDAQPHQGEDSWKEHLNNFLFYRHADYFVFHSHFSRNTFIQSYHNYSSKTSILPLLPYSVCRSYPNETTILPESNYILFFGRISPYKGVNLLISVFEKIIKTDSDWTLLIAGKEVYGYTLDKNRLRKTGGRIRYLSDYLPAKQLMPLIQRSTFVVCPYLEASQSGVLMTCLALQKCVLATRVGAFPEYIKDGENGYLCEPNEDDMERKIKEIISHQSYEVIESNLKEFDTTQLQKEHAEKLWQIWSA